AGGALAEHIERSRGLEFGPGDGLVGKAWKPGEPLWVVDVSSDPRVAQSGPSRAAGVHGAFVFPVSFEGRTIGVLFISSHMVRAPDADLLQTLRVIGSQVGQFLKRKNTEQVLRESEARFRSLTALSTDWYWETDAEHRFVSTPPRVTQITGFTAPTYVGKPRWEVPGVLPASGDCTAQPRGAH